MKNFLKKKYFQLLRKQGIKAGIVPVQNPENEGERLAEVKRLGIMELDLSGERRYNSMTQVATLPDRLYPECYQHPGIQCPAV